MLSFKKTLFAVTALGLLWVGCSSFDPPDLGGLYNRSAQAHGSDRNPIVVIPGLLGSRLEEVASGRVVWGAFGGGYANPQRPADARLIALPLRPGEERPAVRPAGVIETFRARVLGIPIYLQAYYRILRTLGAGGYRDEDLGVSGSIDYGERHFTCFQFDYDWRLDNTENAKRLDEFLRDKRRYVQDALRRQYGIIDEDVRFDILAHSMGGILLRYYLRYGSEPLPEDGSLPELTWAGSQLVERAILVGTPNAGSVEALVQLVEGVKFGPFVARYDAALVASYPAAYQLLPRQRHGAVVDAADPSVKLDIFDPDLWERLGWSLADPAQDRVLEWLLPDVDEAAERRRIALDHLYRQLESAEQFHRALDVPASPPAGTSLHLLTGDAVLTDAVASVDLSNGRLAMVSKAPGDGRVLRSSALLDERVGGKWQPELVTPIGWSDAFFLFENHLGITKDPEFTDNVLYRLLEEPRRSPEEQFEEMREMSSDGSQVSEGS